MDVKSSKIHTNGKIIVAVIVVPFIHSFIHTIACAYIPIQHSFARLQTLTLPLFEQALHRQ